MSLILIFFFSSRRRHTRWPRDWSSDVCSSDLKYFTNSIREEGLLALAKGGVIFTPGSAGTSQEVFQEVTQNHYLTLGIASPMIFFDSHFWTEEWPVYPVDRKSTRLNSSHVAISYAVFCLNKKIIDCHN